MENMTRNWAVSPSESCFEEQRGCPSSGTNQSDQVQTYDMAFSSTSITPDGSMQSLLLSNIDEFTHNNELDQPDPTRLLAQNEIEAVLPSTTCDSPFMGFGFDFPAFDETMSVYDGSILFGLEAFGPTGGIRALPSWKSEALMFSMLYEGIQNER
jgi:hypothetical protein